MKTYGLWVIPRGRWSLFYYGSLKCVRTLRSRTQVTELKHWGLYPFRVCTSSLLSSGSHGKSRRLTLRIGFFSGSLNGLGYSLRVRVHLLAVELFSKGVPLVSLCTLCGLCQKHLCSEVNRIGQIERLDGRLWWNKQQRLEGRNKTNGPVCQLAQSLQSYCTF